MAKIEFTSWELRAYMIIRELLLLSVIEKKPSINDKYLEALITLREQFEEKYTTLETQKENKND